MSWACGLPPRATPAPPRCRPCPAPATPASPPAGQVAAQRQLHDRSPARPREAHDRGKPRPRVAEHVGPAARPLSLPPLLECLPQQPLDRVPAEAGAGAGANLGGGENRTFGYTEVTAIRRLGETEEALEPRYVAPDDGNADDRTVMEVETTRAVAPGETVRFRIEWTSLIPYGSVGRAGWVHDYNFIVQWFPKIGVFWKGKWNAHQFHPWTEFFADYGVYDVSLTVPGRYVVGATGAPREHEGQRGRHQDPALRAGGRPRLRLDGQPPLPREEGHLRRSRLPAGGDPAARAARARAPVLPVPRGHEDRTPGLRHLVGTLPVPQITVVDPAWRSGSGGMEYPTLFTGGANVFAPPALQSPESVTIHECGHQFWYGLVGNNEFEEAWLDEGFNSYTRERPSRSRWDPKAGAGAISGSPPEGAAGRAGRWWRPMSGSAGVGTTSRASARTARRT